MPTNTTSKNLGLIVAIIKSSTQPQNTDVLWLDTSGSQAVRKEYDPISQTWIPLVQSASSAGDGWGTQVAVTDVTLEGDGTISNPLKIGQNGATSGQILRWNGSSFVPDNENTSTGLAVVTADTDIFAGDGTAGNKLKLSDPGTNGFIPKWNSVTSKWYFSADEIGDKFSKNMIMLWSGVIAQIPAGWKLCDGNGGAPVNGVTIPNLSGLFVVGYNSGDTDYDAIGKTGGSKEVTLDINQIPSHNHGVVDNGHSHGIERVGYGGISGSGAKFVGTAANPTTSDGSTKTSTTGITISSNGGGLAHENRPPYYTLAYIIRVA